jgi:ubiquinone/menaquinone biosynthesis C-methylase UbiE
MKDENFNPKKTVYQDMLTVEETHWWYVSLRDLLKYWIQNIQVNNVLDAGCGTGRNLLFFKELGLEINGFDYSNEALNLCKARNLNKVKQGSILKIPFENDSFELITCLDVLSTIPESKLDRAISEFNRVLHKDRYLILNEAAIPWAVSKHFSDWDLKQRFYLANLEKSLKENGFQIIKGTYRVSILFPPILIIRILDNISKNKNYVPDVHKTNKILNSVFYLIMRLENFMLKFINFPIGNSVFIVAKKN